jgi:hypothetical protein
MAKLGIYGDSFADWFYKDSPKWNQENPTLGWPQILAEHYDIENWAEGGTGLYFSYEKFMHTHASYDKIIFIVSYDGRYDLHKDNPLYNRRPSICNYDSARLWLENGNHTDEEKKILLAGMDYFLYIYNQDKETAAYNLMIEKMMSIRPDAIIYPAFKNNALLKDFPLEDITAFENVYYGLNDMWANYAPDMQDFRKNHFTEKNNKLIADMFLTKLSGKEFTLTSEMLNSPDRPWSDYYKKFSHT